MKTIAFQLAIHTICCQGSRLTFQLASPVASDRFDPAAKTNFSLARHLNIHCRIKSSKCSMDPWFSKNRRQNLGTGAAEKHSFLSNNRFMIFTYKIICLESSGAFHSTCNSGLNFHQAGPISFYSRLSPFPTKNYSTKCWRIVMKWLS